jgi:outer membrane protein assembly factor BamB
MKKIVYILIFYAFIFSSCAVLKISNKIKIEESKDWLMPDGNPSRTNIYKTNSPLNPPFKLLWSFDNDAAYPVKNLLASDAVLFSGNLKGEIYGIDMISGKSLGSFSTSSPSQINGYVIYNYDIILSRVGDDKKSIISYNVNTGKENWNVDFGWVVSSPVLKNDNLIFGTMDGYIVNIQPQNGSLIWKYKDKNEYTSNQFSSSSTIYNENIYTGNVNGNLYSLKKSDGSLNWKFKTEGPVYSDVSAFNNKLFFFSDDMNFYCLDTAGNLVWKKDLSTKSYSSASFYNDLVITAAVDGFVYALNFSTGEIVWKFRTNGSIWASPLIAQGKIFIGSLDEYFYCIRADNGELLWKYKLEGRIKSNAVIWNDFIFISSDDKNIYCFK